MNNSTKDAAVCRLSTEAVKNYETWFPGKESALKQTDPEWVEIFGNFAFDEVMKQSKLDMKTRIMVTMASAIAQNTPETYRQTLEAALHNGITPVEIKEILYQSTAYVGAARVMDLMNIANNFLVEHGVKLPLEGQSTTSPETRFDIGLALQKDIFGKGIDEMYRTSPKNQLHFQHNLSANCFGDYQTRKGFDKKTRELLTFSMLISLGGCEPQVKGHIQGNVNVGNDKQTLIDVVTQLLPYNGYPRTLNALRCLNEMIPEK